MVSVEMEERKASTKRFDQRNILKEKDKAEKIYKEEDGV